MCLVCVCVYGVVLCVCDVGVFFCWLCVCFVCGVCGFCVFGCVCFWALGVFGGVFVYSVFVGCVFGFCDYLW